MTGDAVTGHPMIDRALGILREVALTAGAVAGVVCLAFALLGATVGVTPLVVTSGSMTPAIRTGDLAITWPVGLDRIAPDDVVSMLDASGTRVTHRVVSVDLDRQQVRLKGDANDVVDPVPYSAAEQVDLVLVAVPAAGYVATWMSTPTAMLLLGGYAVFLLSVLRQRREPPAQPDQAEQPTQPIRLAQPAQPEPAERPERGRHRAGTGIGVALVLGLAVTATPPPTPTLAAFTDPAPITGTSLATYTVPKPVITGCSVPLLLLAVTITWNAVSTPYPLTYQAQVVETGVILPVDVSGTARSTTYVTPLRTLAAPTHTVRITASLTSTPAWRSVPADQVVNLALLGLAPSCGAAS